MFIATIINFLLASLNIAVQVAVFVVFIRKAFILDIDYSLSKKGFRHLVNITLRNLNLVGFWVGALPVSIKLPLSDLVLFIFGGDLS